MRKDLTIKGRSLGGVSDLTLLAPLRKGLVPSLESVTYKTRVKRLLRTLNGGRALSHEHALLRPFSDAVERVGKIHSVRVAVFEPDDKVLLSVTFDGAWESYLRVLWQKTGRLLDVIFCNTQDYVSAWDHSFEEWCEWARRVQTETAFFYGMPFLSVDDVGYLRASEQAYRQAADADLAVLRSTVATAEERAYGQREVEPPRTYPEVFRQGLQTLVGLHRLADLYLPGSPDAAYLEGAANELLLEFGSMLWGPSPQFDESLAWAQERYGRQLEWFKVAQGRALPEVRQPPKLPDTVDEMPALDRRNVQGGIVEPYRGVTHGLLLLLSFDDAASGADFLDALRVTTAQDSTRATEGPMLCNIAFTPEGLRRLGLREDELELFPQEFREGMEARSSQLGDVRGNHPRRWRLPQPNWPQPAAPDTPPIDLRAVHAVLQWRVRDTSDAATAAVDIHDLGHPLVAALTDLQARSPGVRVLAVQALRRYGDDDAATEHFGFADGMSDPSIEPQPGPGYRNQVHLGELLLGYDNAADASPPAGAAACPMAQSERRNWLRDGSFLVVRKLRQNVQRLDAVVEAAAAQTRLKPDLIRAKMMGREPGATPRPLIPGTWDGTNHFSFQRDPQGGLCPFHAHIRRANPRALGNAALPVSPGGRMPRIVRRGLSYGPRYDGAALDDATRARNAQERGLVFMAYNASIGEQFEVIQRWLAGGNGSRSYSGVSDPFLGVPENGKRRWFRFEHDGAIVRMPLDGTEQPMGDPDPIVRLEWGAYLFVPSIAVLRRLAALGRGRLAVAPAPAWSVSDGERRIAELMALEQQQGPQAAKAAWKAALEDPEAQEKFSAASIWAAIRELHGGVLRSPYGVLVADRDLVMQVLQDPGHVYSVSGYMARMRDSIGPIYLGLDAGQDYAAQSAASNAAIQSIPADLAFDTARQATAALVSRLVESARQRAQELGDGRWEMVLDAKEVSEELLAVLCEEWFGLGTQGENWQRGGARWDWTEGQPPLYPGHFTAPSRFIFQPNPGGEVVDFGCRYGRAATAAMSKLVQLWRAQPGRMPDLRDPRNAPVRERLRAAILVGDDEAAARTMVGALMGMIPTLDASFRLVLNEWLREASFWSLRAELSVSPLANVDAAFDRLARALRTAMQLRPTPELVWRTAVTAQTLGHPGGAVVELRPGDTVVVAIVSAMQQNLAANRDELFPMFGGDRRGDHPTHACPGYAAAVAVLLGTLTALLEAPGAMRPGPGPLTLMFEGPSGFTPVEIRRAPPRAPRSQRTEQVPATVLAWGDSWVHYPNNLCAALAATGRYRIEGSGRPGRPLGGLGLTLKEMAQGPQLDSFAGLVEEMLSAGERPLAVLLSGGGNDAVRSRLAKLLKPREAGGDVAQAFIEEEVHKLVEVELHGYWRTILAALRSAFAGRAPLRVVLHGYDRPIPDGRNLLPSDAFSWLKQPITNVRRYNLDEGRVIMHRLIDRLNHMLAELASKEFEFVRHADLRGTLRNDEATYREDWENELHPDEGGFEKLAQRIEAAFEQA